MGKGEETPESWENIYQNEKPGWDIGYVTPAIKHFYEENCNTWLKPGHIIIPGCGFGHEVSFFLEKGFTVSAIDFAKTPIDALQKKWGNHPQLKLICNDMFALTSKDLLPADYILEHTCFCAIPIKNRPKYVDFMKRFLKPQGVFFGLFFKFNETNEGPPHPITDQEIQTLFSKDFEIQTLEYTAFSLEKRKGNEKIFKMIKK